MEWLRFLASAAADITAVLALLAVLIKPLRQRFLGDTSVREGQKCLLRSQIVSIYYRHLEEKALRQYEYENLCYCFRAYKALGGNSFAEHIYEEMQDWKIVS